MFCPHCGVKNDGTPIVCASCRKTIPQADADRTPQPGRPRPARAAAAASTERYSSVGDRMLALLLDRIVILAFLLIAVAAVADQWRDLQPRLPSAVFSGILGGFIIVLVVFLYHIIFEAGFGTTLGKAVMGLQVRSDGERNRFVAVVIRNALRVIDGLVLYLVGFLLATFTQRRQRFGDAVGGTVVLDMPLSKGARAAMMVLWLALIAVAIGVAAALCPTCLSFRA
ncbi:MAG TPA: RDD family protein [Thermoanaerobaculia bacterium]|nr:RDD family protein [Thermoanaerobaculia bacterium]